MGQRMRQFFIIGLLAVLAGCTAPAAPGVVTGSKSPALRPELDQAGFTTQLNALRRDKGLPHLTPDSQLLKAAQAHANDMLRRGYFAHRSPEGAAAKTRITKAGFAACSWGENIAFGQTSESAAFEAWRTSRGHLNNMLGASYTAFGLARADSNWVLVLASRC